VNNNYNSTNINKIFSNTWMLSHIVEDYDNDGNHVDYNDDRGNDATIDHHHEDQTL
jgi:hypothetical protein